MHTIVHYDQSGDLRHGAFWEFEVPFLLDEPQLDNIFPARYSKPPIPPIWGRKIRERVWAEVVETKVVRTIPKCRLNPKHVTSIYGEVSADLHCTGDPIADFVPSPDAIIVTSRVRELLTSAKLRGCSYLPLSVKCCQPYELPDVLFWTVNFDGANCDRGATVVPPSPNVCPFCEYSPIACPACDEFERYCPRCGEKTIVTEKQHEGPSDPRYIVELPPSEGRILDGKHWDSSDFVAGIGSGFVSSRVIRCLLDNDLCPFVAWPARMDVTGMSEEQRAAFDWLSAIDLYSGLPTTD